MEKAEKLFPHSNPVLELKEKLWEKGLIKDLKTNWEDDLKNAIVITSFFWEIWFYFAFSFQRKIIRIMESLS